MTWAKLDDGIFRNPKIQGLTKDAKLLYLASIVGCAAGLTDGAISPTLARVCAAEVGIDDLEATVKELITATAWEWVAAGWAVHDYLDYNPSREQVIADREAARERQRKRRHAVTSGVSHNVSNGVGSPSPSRPVPSPSRTQPEITESDLALSLSAIKVWNQRRHPDQPSVSERRSLTDSEQEQLGGFLRELGGDLHRFARAVDEFAASSEHNGEAVIGYESVPPRSLWTMLAHPGQWLDRALDDTPSPNGHVENYEEIR